MLDQTSAPELPYYAVIFTRIRSAEGSGFARTGEDPSEPVADRPEAPLPDYAETAEQMLRLAEGQDGFLGMDSVEDASGEGITISYWRDKSAIAAWRHHAEHRVAQEHGRTHWYRYWRIRVAKVGREQASPHSS
jgi:heme-degrading monooxygenase HmoA